MSKNVINNSKKVYKYRISCDVLENFECKGLLDPVKH